MKITIYELLELIKNGKAPKKIKVTGRIYEFDEELDLYTTIDVYDGLNTCLGGVTGEINLIANAFNDIVEILPEENDEWEDIEELPKLHPTDYSYDTAVENRKAINQLIKNQNYLKEKSEGKNETL